MIDLYLPPATKLGPGYIFTGICDSVHRVGCLVLEGCLVTGGCLVLGGLVRGVHGQGGVPGLGGAWSREGGAWSLGGA